MPARRIMTMLASTSLAVTALLGSSPSAQADDPVFCGIPVGGAILAKYKDYNYDRGFLGCPKTTELVNPDDVGRRQEFTGGTVYWKPATGAHPVGGAIGAKWADKNWESGPLGYPTSDELANPDGFGRRQEFEGGSVYWASAYGAHPVWGKIGKLWGDYGWEGGSFGYPTSDEKTDTATNQTYQNFSNRQSTLFWSSGNREEGCSGECTGYLSEAATDWFKQVRVEIPAAFPNEVVIRAYPTDAGFRNAVGDLGSAWDQLWTMAPPPQQLSVQSKYNSEYEQFICHAHFVFPDPLNSSGWSTGDSWDVESWRADVGTSNALSPVFFALHHCNWDPKNPS
ncbi:hypothetical protein AB0N07_41610 [Streptomyces sp. NPDC051172]|uniref:hypothetical protein n=1 Tax=Streptomyces sp. NPDC051172 TaxID=3155796 RepID=UPI00341D1633